MKHSGLITAGTFIACLFLLSASLASAQTLQTLYAFVSPNGCNPQAPLTLGPDGNFYGTTQIGGTNGGYGTIFKVTTNGVLTSLFQFSMTNGAYPYSALTLGNDGCFYGTTENGGSNGYGTLFKITPDGIFTSLVSFNSTNGANPTASLTLGPDGSLYGTTVYGGTNGAPYGYGVVFKLTTNAALKTLASFTSTYHGEYNTQNTSSLIFGSDGALYGTTAYGGTYGDGLVFRVTTNGALSILVSLVNNYGNGYAASLVLGKDGNFYGVTVNSGSGGGSIYKISPSGFISYMFSFYNYAPYTMGILPIGNLIVGNDGYLYGTTMKGGTNGGFGTVFKISTNGVLASMASFGLTNGAYPYASLVLGANGSFYGTTYGGGDYGQGAIFQLTTNGMLSEVAPFPGSLGCWPKAGLTIGGDGNFYGTTSSGGTNGGLGTFFKLSTNGSFTSLTSLTNGSPQVDLTLGNDGNFYTVFNSGTVMRLTLDGQIAPVAFLEYPSTNGDGPPYSSLTQGSDGAFYGTAGSSIASGSVFRVTTDGFVTNLVSFAGTNGSGPLGGVCIGSDGNFYGTTLEGGAQYGEGEGTVFKLTTNGVLSTLKRFPQADIGSYIYDGSEPWAGLCLGYDGFLYGTTACGGFFTNSVYTFGCGEIFRVTSNAVVGSGSFDETNGAWPASKLVAGNDGNLYGTTLFGGTNFGPGIRRGLGTIYRINPNHGITVLISFNSLNGAYVGGGVISTQPQPDLIIGNDGNLYGTSTYGGMGGNGTIFRVLLPADISVPPQSQTNIAGATVIFNVGATSLQPLIYQWQMSGTNLVDGGNVSGSGTSNLIVTEISDCDAGLYSVIVSNSNFGVTNFATLTVVDPPVITNQPIAQRVIVGNSVAFGISVSNAPVQYQWLFNSTNIIGATNAGFAIQSVAVTNSGIYCVVVTNLAGSVTSSNASLVVLVPPSLALQFTAGYPVLNLNGMLSNNFVVQYNTDLSGTNWTTLLSLSNLLTTPYLLLDPAGVVPPARFYRALMQ